MIFLEMEIKDLVLYDLGFITSLNKSIHIFGQCYEF